MFNKHSKPTHPNNYQKDPFVQKILAGIPAQTAATFTDAQLSELKRVFIERVSNSSAVDMRLSIPFFKRKFYLVLLMGKEKRSQQRLKNSEFKILNGFSGTMYTLAIISFILSSLYIIERELRINSFPYNQIEKVRESLKENPKI
ncbi:hypothetical protein H6G06_11435 [Anabaena sphaerica FACHB-251]|uniref:Uncharacterized protein n=1 Tax=Anabaena sphaerica FACHB-251 TaxID=2692883 RepID=A0A926WGJ7_9NOST|nr:hypothetical protein [Anabaena sphaerica]MBD2294087.1 hypothetical protein [Anabaena sphaerica FACHB-251]